MTVRESPAVLFAALGDENRLRLVALLRDAGQLSITGLTPGSRVMRQAITKHLNVLEKAGLVRCTCMDRRPFGNWTSGGLRTRLYLALISNVDGAVR